MFMPLCNETTQFVLNYGAAISLLLGDRKEGQFIKAQENSGRSQAASRAASKHSDDAPKLPFFFLDTDSICHRPICGLRVRISMISNHSASLLSPWHHLWNTQKAQTPHQALGTGFIWRTEDFRVIHIYRVMLTYRHLSLIKQECIDSIVNLL